MCRKLFNNEHWSDFEIKGNNDTVVLFTREDFDYQRAAVLGVISCLKVLFKSRQVDGYFSDKISKVITGEPAHKRLASSEMLLHSGLCA